MAQAAQPGNQGQPVAEETPPEPETIWRRR
jgi:hypothetical protein